MSERLPTRLPEITDRQREVARLVAAGRTNEQIADDLGISLAGAKYHVSELLGRLGLARREEIAEWYRHERRIEWRRKLGAAFGAPLAWGAGGVAALVLVGVALIVVVPGLAGTSSTEGDKPAEWGELRQVSDDVMLVEGYRDGDFIIAVEWYSSPSEVLLIDPASGTIVARIEGTSSSDVFVRREARELIVSEILLRPDVTQQHQHRLRIFDLRDDLRLLREFNIERRSTEAYFWTSMNLSTDEQLLYNPTSLGAAQGGQPGYLDVIDVATGETIEVTLEDGCRYGRMTPLPDGTMLTRGGGTCATKAFMLNERGERVAEWMIAGHRAQDANLGIAFASSDGSVGRLGRDGELDLSQGPDLVLAMDDLWDQGWVYEINHATLRDGRLVMLANPREGDSIPGAFIVFNPDTLALEHFFEIDPRGYATFQPRPDGEGAWLLHGDGTIDAIDWDGTTRRVPNIRLDDGEWVLPPRQ